MHVCHIGDGATALSIVVEITNACVKISSCHRLKSLLVNQFHRSVTICHSDVLEQTLLRRCVSLV